MGKGTSGTAYHKASSMDNSNNKSSKNRSKAAYSVRIKPVYPMKNRQRNGADREQVVLGIIMDNSALEHVTTNEW